MLNISMDFKISIEHWLSKHKSTTLPNWIKRNPQVQEWVISNTLQYNPKHIMESVYIMLNGPPKQCSFGNKLQFNTFEKGYRVGCVLGNKCKCVANARMSNQKKTIIKKYGVDTVGKIPGVIEKREQTTQQKYGVKYAMQSDFFKEMKKISDNAKMQSDWDEITQKREKTCLEKYGVLHHMKLETQQEKVKNSNLEKYGVAFPLQNANSKIKCRAVWDKKEPEELKKIKDKRTNTIKKLYNVEAASQIGMSQETLNILKNEELFKTIIFKKTRHEAKNLLGIADHTLYLYAKKYNASNLFSYPLVSGFELEVRQYIESLGFSPTYNVRDKIPPKELDIFILEKNIAIECCGLYWHAENSANRGQNYHSNKHKECAKQDITLITLFQDEWEFNKEKVKNRLHHLLKTSQKTIYARQCNILIDDVAIDKFINETHLQSPVNSSFSIALTYNNEIVAAMSFKKPRYNKKYEYEILRFCTKGHVVGAASKLFAQFKKLFDPSSVISYSDNRWGTGNVYSELGFTKHQETIGYYYTDYKNRFNRINYQKHKLVKNGADPALTEWEIMQINGYDRIWDCGQSLWVWNQ